MALYHIDKKTEPSSRMVASDPVFTTMVPGAWQNDRLGADTPRGVLGGMLAVVSGGDYTVNIASNATAVDYFFYNDAAGGAFENAPAVASGKIALLPVNGGDCFEVDVYETHASGGASIMVNYTIGAALYCSARGLVTNVSSGQQVGKCVKVPTTANPRLGIKLTA